MDDTISGWDAGQEMWDESRERRQDDAWMLKPSVSHCDTGVEELVVLLEWLSWLMLS